MREVDSDLVRTIRMNGRNQMKGEMIRWLDTHPKATALDLVKHFCGTIWMKLVAFEYFSILSNFR